MEPVASGRLWEVYINPGRAHIPSYPSLQPPPGSACLSSGKAQNGWNSAKQIEVSFWRQQCKLAVHVKPEPSGLLCRSDDRFSVVWDGDLTAHACASCNLKGLHEGCEFLPLSAYFNLPPMPIFSVLLFPLGACSLAFRLNRIHLL